jgi:hypothetical protein
MEKEIELYKRIGDPIKATETMGEWFACSGLFGCSKKEQGYILAMVCLSENMTPREVIETYHLVTIPGEGTKLSMRSVAMLGRYRKAGGKCQWLDTTGKIAKARFTYRENDSIWEYSIDEAKAMGKADLTNYKKWPAAMLRARLVSNTLRMIAPEVVGGLYVKEELISSGKEPEMKQAVAVEVSKTEPNTEEAEIAQLEEILEPYTEVANKFFLEKKLIQEGQNFRDLSPENRSKVFENKNVLVAKLAKMLDEKTNETAEVVEAEVVE